MKSKNRSPKTLERKPDPFLERETAKYENPIVSREMILEFLKESGTSLSRNEIAKAHHISAPAEVEALRRRLRAMERDGQLMSDTKGRYALLERLECLTGRVSSRRDGSGWVTSQNGTEVFLSPQEMLQVFPGDEVCIDVHGYHRRRKTLEGKITQVLKRNTFQMVGRFYEEAEGISYVSPENPYLHQTVLIPNCKAVCPKNGDFVLVQIKTQPTEHTQPLGEVIEILGAEHSANSIIEMALRAHHLPHEWPQAVLDEAEALPEAVICDSSLLKDREDWRSLHFVTIDGEDAKDFDDAVYGEKTDAGWLLYVAIADVSYYVRLNSALDTEAQFRGNSVYFPNRVIPMLPEKLSNGLCSLKPETDRLTLGCKLWVNEKGEVERYEFAKSVIHSKARLTYTKVADMLENSDSAYRTTYQNALPSLENLHEIFKVLFAAREIRGALDFDTIETRMMLGADGKIEKIVPVKRNIAHRLIEECMLAANVAAAEFLLKHKAEGVFRIHEPPRAEKLDDLRAFLKLRGLVLQGGESPTPKDFSHLIRSIQGRSDQNLIQTVILRSMSQAIYSPENSGHYGLAYEAYTHFTSPIRRYPDLLVHRVIRLLLNKKDKAAAHYLESTLMNLATNLSHTERRADEASRDVESALKCVFMEDHVGLIFEGLITGVTHFGFFVMIDPFYIDGLVHVTSLKNDYYQFDEVQHALIGERSGKVYRLGDRVKVKVLHVNVSTRKIDFEWVK